MPTTYNENGVTYDIAGLLSTMVHMSEKSKIKDILLLRIDAVIMSNVIWSAEMEDIATKFDSHTSADAKWVIKYIMNVVKSAPRDEQKEIYNLISNS